MSSAFSRSWTAAAYVGDLVPYVGWRSLGVAEASASR